MPQEDKVEQGPQWSLENLFVEVRPSPSRSHLLLRLSRLLPILFCTRTRF